MSTIWLKSHLESKEKTLDWLLRDLENKSQKNTKDYLSAYDIWANNEVLAAMTRTKEIEEKSLNYISSLMKKTLENSKNSKSKIILEKLV